MGFGVVNKQNYMYLKDRMRGSTMLHRPLGVIPEEDYQDD